ncbi:hypothetical protein GOP47_0001298 [Adiantum capillus-veneris]|uniref:NAD-dependent epimerase/dehydratase domain-containing protein n=1 Tax=Adiantum capillus-veneris TaxID=13818 RepID=A0A9D4V7Z7_ADICA|nr:hypothetical protein GOP47_0001298 [Adiantum capillus-veneris]
MEVCVTGGTGYIASHLIKALLGKGYRVRTTVRNAKDANKTNFLWSIPGATERLSLYEANLLEEGSFDEAIRGVDGVFHVASPVIVTNWQDPEKSFLEPCLKGTNNVLASCAKSTTIRRVVLTSSCSSIRYDFYEHNNAPSLDESYWSNPDYCRHFQLWYAWAKTLAEKEAWKIAQGKNLDLVVVNPSFVVGPLLSKEPTSTILLVLGLLKGFIRKYPNSRMGYVHIDDVVLAHLLAYEDLSISGRLVCSGNVYHWREIAEMLKMKYPLLPIPTICSDELGNDIPHTMNTTKLQKLGLKAFKSVEEMFDDCITSLQIHGHLM